MRSVQLLEFRDRWNCCLRAVLMTMLSHAPLVLKVLCAIVLGPPLCQRRCFQPRRIRLHWSSGTLLRAFASAHAMDDMSVVTALSSTLSWRRLHRRVLRWLIRSLPLRKREATVAI